MSSLLQDNCSFQSCNTSAGYKYCLWFFCRIDLTFFFTSKCRITKTCNTFHIHIFKSVITSLITANTVIDIIYFSCFCLLTEFWICKLCTSHNNHIYFVFFQNLFCKFRCINSSNPNCQHSCFLADFSCIVNIESLWKIYRRNFEFQSI